MTTHAHEFRKVCRQNISELPFDWFWVGWYDTYTMREFVVWQPADIAVLFMRYLSFTISGFSRRDDFVNHWCLFSMPILDLLDFLHVINYHDISIWLVSQLHLQIMVCQNSITNNVSVTTVCPYHSLLVWLVNSQSSLWSLIHHPLQRAVGEEKKFISCPDNISDFQNSLLSSLKVQQDCTGTKHMHQMSCYFLAECFFVHDFNIVENKKKNTPTMINHAVCVVFDVTHRQEKGSY